MLEHLPADRPALVSGDGRKIWHQLEAVLNQDQFGRLQSSVQLLLLRVLELALLSDNTLIEIALYPDTYLGVAEDMIHDRLVELFPDQSIPQETVQHIRSCLLSRAPLRTGKQGPSRVDLQSTLVRAGAYTLDNRLRCQNCGYHFRRNDLGATRLDMADEAGLILAETVLPQRLRDPWKTARPEELSMSIDHVVPEVGFGWTAADNLQILCGLCNKAKQIYRWGGERVSTANAASLAALVGGTRMTWAIKSALYSAISDHGSCGTCEGTATGAELTCRHQTKAQDLASMAPWSLEVVCYDCFDPGAEPE